MNPTQPPKTFSFSYQPTGKNAETRSFTVRGKLQRSGVDVEFVRGRGEIAQKVMHLGPAWKTELEKILAHTKLAEPIPSRFSGGTRYELTHNAAPGGLNRPLDP